MLRQRAANQHHRVTPVELFFDLVFVFAVTQISHALLKDFSPLGIARTTLLFLAVWWVWIYTSWVTNWLDPDRSPVRILLFLLTLGGLVLSTSLPDAFSHRGLWFALAFATMQVGRSLVMLILLPAAERGMRLNFVRITTWLAVSGVFWIAGGLAEPQPRLALWAIAVAIEYIGPVARFFVPRLGASSMEDWNVEGGHLAERCAGFIIIALGESVLMTGATFGEMAWTGPEITAFVTSFIGAVAMWWIYFHKGAETGAERMSASAEPGRIARLAYTYLHMPIVAGIIVAAVANELVLAHPWGHTDVKVVLNVVGSALLFLFGALLFKHGIHGRWQLSHMVGIAVLVLLGVFGQHLPPLWLLMVATLILVIVAAWEAISLGRGTMPVRR